MCYVLHLSTTSSEDLSLISSPLVRFQPPSPDDSSLTSRLIHTNKWYINANRGGCSCDLRHLAAESASLGFGRPEPWMEENEEVISATRFLAAVIRRLRAGDHQVDCIDVWAGSTGDGLTRLKVDLASVADDEIRFFENYHFLFD